MDLDTPPPVQIAQDLGDGGVRDLVDRLACLDLRIDDADAVLEERRQVPAGQVAIFVDSRPEDGTSVLAIPGRVVRSAAEEGDSKRCPTDNHRVPRSPNSIASTRAHRACSTARCASCTYWVSSLGIVMLTSAGSPIHFPLPVRSTTRSSRPRAASTARTTFGDRPLVVIATSTSPLR